MPFFVVISQQVDPDNVEQMLAKMRDDLAVSHILHPGRRNARIFQQLDRPNHLMALTEWDSRAAYEQLWRSPGYQALTVNADPPARIEQVTRLRSFMRMSAQPSFVGCVRFTAPDAHADALERLVLDVLRYDNEASEGLLSHDVFRIGAVPGRILLVHSWRSINGLEQFRVKHRQRHDALLNALQVSAERFTGSIAALYTRQALSSAPATRV